MNQTTTIHSMTKAQDRHERTDKKECKTSMHLNIGNGVNYSAVDNAGDLCAGLGFRHTWQLASVPPLSLQTMQAAHSVSVTLWKLQLRISSLTTFL